MLKCTHTHTNVSIYNFSSYLVLNPLTPNGLYSDRAVSRMATIVVANSVSKFGGILFTPIHYLLWFAMLQDPSRSGFHTGYKLYPLLLLNPFTYDDIYAFA